MKSLIILAAMLTSLSTMAGTNVCGGSNPSWEIKITDTALVSKSGVSDALVSKTVAANRTKEWGAFVAKSASGATATVVAGECVDGSYDSIYLRHIVYTTADGKVLYGCCDERD